MKTRLGVAVAALMLGAQLGSPAVAQQASLEQLELISEYIEAGDLESLISFIGANPELMEGDTALAVRLREFMIAAGDLSRYLAFDPRADGAIARGLTDTGEDDLSGSVPEEFGHSGNGGATAGQPGQAPAGEDGTADAGSGTGDAGEDTADAGEDTAGASEDTADDGDVADAGGADPGSGAGDDASIY